MMAYTADISRTNPASFLFLIDQSGSMTRATGRPARPAQDGPGCGRH